jgi:hypothetical protein
MIGTNVIGHSDSTPTVYRSKMWDNHIGLDKLSGLISAERTSCVFLAAQQYPIGRIPNLFAGSLKVIDIGGK